MLQALTRGILLSREERCHHQKDRPRWDVSLQCHPTVKKYCSSPISNLDLSEDIIQDYGSPVHSALSLRPGKTPFIFTLRNWLLPWNRNVKIHWKVCGTGYNVLMLYSPDLSGALESLWRRGVCLYSLKSCPQVILLKADRCNTLVEYRHSRRWPGHLMRGIQ